MKTFILAAALAAVVPAAASAQSVDWRHNHQQARIDHGVANGSLTGGEARRLERQQGSIDAQEARMRGRNGGHLTGYDRAVLQHRENRANNHIYNAKHNYRHY